MIFCIVLAIIVLIAWFGLTIYNFTQDVEDGFVTLIGGLFAALLIDFILLLPFIALDKGSGSTIGTITAVDKNFFGTTKLYLKTAENNEDEYCMEDNEVINIAKELIGKKVQLYYGERVGLYHLNQCRQAPIDEIKLAEE